MTASLDEKVKGLSSQQRQQLSRMMVPRVVPEFMTHMPHPKQQVFLSLNCKEALYGGSAGGGKSDALLMSALQYVDVPGYSALIIRRTWPDLDSPGAIMDRARTWLQGTSARMKDGGRQWLFPSGARLTFGYFQHEKEKYKFQSTEHQFIGFDELTQFPETQYEYLFSRLRKPTFSCIVCETKIRQVQRRWVHITKRGQKCRAKHPVPDMRVVDQYGPAKDGTTIRDVPLRIRSATNPGNIGHEWVFRRFIDEESKDPSSIFLPASLRDNPSLDRREYEESLAHLGGVERERLLNGDWAVVEQGDYFQRAWFEIIDAPVQDRKVERVRFWDMAATEGGGDYTVGTLCAWLDGKMFIEHQIRGQYAGAESEKIMRHTADTDGRHVAVRMEQEPGSAGKNYIDHIRRNVLQGYNFDGMRPTGDKGVRAKPWAVQAENGNVFLVSGVWNKRFLDEAELFPLGANDDQVDSVSGGYEYLCFSKRTRIRV